MVTVAKVAEVDKRKENVISLLKMQKNMRDFVLSRKKLNTYNQTLHFKGISFSIQTVLLSKMSGWLTSKICTF